MKLHGVLVVFRHPREVQHAGHGGGHQRTVDDAPTASSAKPEQLSKRKQRSSIDVCDSVRLLYLLTYLRNYRDMISGCTLDDFRSNRDPHCNEFHSTYKRNCPELGP